MKSCFKSTDILLPKKDVAMETWAVVACDQYTSEEEYWQDVESLVNDKPSTFHLIFPEVYLGQEDHRIESIQKEMKSYLDNNILEKRISDGFVLVERTIQDKVRLGLIGAIDLEAYDYTPGSHSLVRATEGTIESRIPPRMKIRENAMLECPHIMVLIDDRKDQLIKPMHDYKDRFELLYDFDLLKNGGHVTGYAISDEFAQAIDAKLSLMQRDSESFFLAVGDGNHSLATAKACWNKLKETLSDEEKETHPARYAMVELVNLYDPALIFEPIHRLLFKVNFDDLYQSFTDYLKDENVEYTTGEDIVFVDANHSIHLKLLNEDDRLPIDILQKFLDQYLKNHPESHIDYVHGTEVIDKLSKKKNNVGILLDAIDKKMLFPAISAGGVLPRKTFSMGEAYEKRYYVECRQIMK